MVCRFQSRRPPGCHRSLGSGAASRSPGAVVPTFLPPYVTSNTRLSFCTLVSVLQIPPAALPAAAQSPLRLSGRRGCPGCAPGLPQSNTFSYLTNTFGSLPAWYPPCPPPPMIVRQISEGRCTQPRWLKLFPGITSFTFLLLYNNVRLSSPTLCGHNGRSKGVYCVDIPRVVASRTPVEITESLFAVHPEAPFLRPAALLQGAYPI